MEWIKIDHMPADGSTFIAIWKGRISICQYDEYEQQFYIAFGPASVSGAHFKVEKERESKFSYWMELPDKNSTTWIKVENRHDLPQDNTEFLAIWHNKIALCQFDQDEGRFFIIWQPAEYPECWFMPQERENRFTHWMKLPEKPKN